MFQSVMTGMIQIIKNRSSKFYCIQKELSHRDDIKNKTMQKGVIVEWCCSASDFLLT